MSGERYHPNLGSATLITAVIILFFTLLNAIFGPWPGHFSEKMYGLPLIMGLLGFDTSQPIWGPTGVFSFQEFLLLFIAAICGGVSYWARRLRPEFSVPEGMTLSDFSERQFTDTQVATSGFGKQSSSMTIESSPISSTPLSSDLLSDYEIPTTSAIVDNNIGVSSKVIPSTMEEPISNPGVAVAQSAPISGDGKVRDFGGTAEVINVPLPGVNAEVKAETEATYTPDLPEIPTILETTRPTALNSLEVPLPQSPTTSELPEVPTLPEVPALPEVPSLPEIPEVQEVPLPPSPITAELEDLEAYPDLKLDLPALPNFENQ